ncbi:ATP-binding cassette domain-containing protein [Desulfomarina profundi]|nr:ATP-binding cassette domain-containing protein [Desulfomarina profundi]
MNLQVDIHLKRGDFNFKAAFETSSERCGIFGPSGSGKSTLMLMLAGLLTPDKGRIVLHNEILFDSEEQINLKPQKRRTGVVFQHGYLFPHMSVRRNLLYGWKRIAPILRKEEPGKIIEVLELEHLLDRKVTALSGGEQQRVALGRTVLSCPQLILMDEPLTGLDSQLKKQIICYLLKLFEECGIPFLFISHSVEEMSLMAEEVLVFRRGTLRQTLREKEFSRKNGSSLKVDLKKAEPVKDLP